MAAHVSVRRDILVKPVTRVLMTLTKAQQEMPPVRPVQPVRRRAVVARQTLTVSARLGLRVLMVVLAMHVMRVSSNPPWVRTHARIVPLI